MTRDQLLQRLCDLLGYKLYLQTGERLYRAHVEWVDPVHGPIFDNGDSIDFLAAVWDIKPLKDWYWGKCWGEMVAQKKGTYRQVTLPETGNFYADFLALTVAVLEHERGAGDTK